MAYSGGLEGSVLHTFHPGNLFNDKDKNLTPYDLLDQNSPGHHTAPNIESPRHTCIVIP